jgi:predicted outer membrane repeat protein
MKTLQCTLLSLALSSWAFASGNLYFVMPTGSDASAGTSWATAFQTLRHADSVAVSGDVIWVAAGTYTPAVSDPSASFTLKSGVAIYGGFAGTETALNQRDWQTNVTTLSGGGTSHTVVYALFADATAVLDGFVISGGSSTSDGAGINLLLSNPRLTNLTITGNHTSANGGGLCNNTGNPTITNCSFIGNTANDGGGVYNYSGGVPVISDCIFRSNTATSFGGGFYNTDNTIAPHDILFDSNHATLGGGALFETASSTSTTSMFINLTLYGNTSKYGGAIFVSGLTSSTIVNSIMWNDTATTNGSEIYSTASSGSSTISYSLVEGGVSGSGVTGSGAYTDGGHNLDPDPLFTDFSSHNFTLTASSPAIDSGNNTVSTATTDLAGNTRISNGTVDIGAYEYQGAPLAVLMTSFDVVTTGTGVELRWTTATEVNNFGFSVERKDKSNSQSTIGNPPWSDVGFVRGAGTSSSPRKYAFVDANVHLGDYSYRIKQTDKNGSSTYSSSLEVNVGLAPKAFSLSQNYPNPFNPTTTIQFSIAKLSIVNLKVYDLLGREVETLANGAMDPGVHTVQFDASKFSSGAYFYRLDAVGNDGDKFVSTKKLMLAK